MRPHIIIAAILTLFLPIRVLAQDNGLEPGVYALVDGEYKPLSHSSSTFSLDDSHEDGSHVHKFYYGESSGVVTEDSFIMVVGDDSNFFWKVTPSCMKVLPLEIDKDSQMREYDARSISVNVDFEWDRISENSFLIRIYNFVPGEYGFILRNEGNYKFNYNIVYGFTIPQS